MELEQALLRSRWVDKVPQANRSIRRACSEFCYLFSRLHLFFKLGFALDNADWNGIGYWLNIVDGAFVGHERAVDGYVIKFGYVPDKEHVVRVDCHKSLVLFVDQSRQNVTEERVLVLRNLYPADAC